LLLVVDFELPINELPIYLQDLEPQFFPLLLNPLAVGPQQRLLEHLFPKDLVHIPVETNKVPEGLVAVYILYS